MSERPTDTAPADEKTASLDELRKRIDGIDADMHELLIERSSIIDALIAVKQAKKTGVAFRPGREANMMRRIADRHHGTLPLVTVEHLWREIISTFTYLQAPYRVHVAADGRSQAMRDVARFYFGFTVPLSQHESPVDAVAAVTGSRSDLAIVPLGETGVCWWDALDCKAAPRIIARLPFLMADGRSAGEPAVIVSNPLDDPVEPEVLCYSAKAEISGLASAPGLELLAHRGGGDFADVLFAIAAETDHDAVPAIRGVENLREAGGYARTCTIDAGRE